MIISIGAPAALFVLWTANDALVWRRNLASIKELRRLIGLRETQAAAVNEEIKLLEVGDDRAWRRVLRQELYALQSGEVEYRFSQ